MVLKIDLSKAYDRVSWTFLRIILSKMGFSVPFISWIMSSLSSVYFAILINGAASSVFKYGRGLRQGCPLDLLLFLIVVEGLGRALLSAKAYGEFHGISFGNDITLSHVLFVDDIVMISNGYEQSLSILYEMMQTFCKASRMLINEDNSALLYSGLDDVELITVHNIFSFSVAKLEVGLKYLGFYLKPCRHFIKDWDWLVAKVEKRIRTGVFDGCLREVSLYWLNQF